MPKGNWCSRALLSVAALTTLCTTENAPVGVGSFPELLLAVGSGARAVEITNPEIVFDHQLEVWPSKTVFVIESTIGARLSGGNHTRLFFLQNRSKLSLRGVDLVHGVASAHSPHGGAIFMSAGSELQLYSARVFNNRAAQWGGAIYSMSATVTTTNCTMTSNSAHHGGTVLADGDSTVVATNCTMTSNSAWVGGAIAALGISTVTATNCTMRSNSADLGGGAVYAVGDSTVTATNCEMISNSATLGGAVFAARAGTVIATDCTMTSNSASSGGVLCANEDSTFTVTDCTMTTNTADFGGSTVFAAGSSIVTTADCVMTSNAASLGGALYANDYSTVVVSFSTMTSNSAYNSGGVVFADHYSNVVVTDSTMFSNSAYAGGAVAAVGNSIATAADCTMTLNSGSGGGGAIIAREYSTVTAQCTIFSNSASRGGAVAAEDDSIVTATDCTMTTNSAFTGGAVAVQGNAEQKKLTTATLTLANCVLTSNTASSSGAALIVREGGIADLVKTVFQANIGTDGDDGVGIVNLNGQVQCDAIVGCLPVCTVCRGEVPSLPPTRPPIVQITATPTSASRTRKTDGWPAASTFAVVALSIWCLASSVLAVKQLWRLKLGRDADQRSGRESSDGVEVNLLQSPLVQKVVFHDVATTRNRNAAEEPVHTGNRVALPWSAIGSSPASILAINREMRIEAWSQGACDSCLLWCYGPSHVNPALRFVSRVHLFVGAGMFVSVPLVDDPRDQLITALPFVNPSAGIRCHNAIRQVFDARIEQENVQIVLNLETLNGPTLLEMVANVVRTESNVLVILTGREVDSALASLLHNPESVTGDQQFDDNNSETISATSRSADKEPMQPQRSGTLDQNSAQAPMSRELELRRVEGITAQRLQKIRAEAQLRRDSDSSRRVPVMRYAASDTSSTDLDLRRRYALRAACSKLRAVGAFVWNGRNKTKRMLAMWLRTNKSMNLAVVCRIGEFCWKDGWRGVACGGDRDHTRMAAVEAEAAAAAAATRLAVPVDRLRELLEVSGTILATRSAGR